MVLAAVGHHQVVPGVSAGQLFFLSDLIGKGVSKLRSLGRPEESSVEAEAAQDGKAA
jgi:hypothetical protein